jgi:hypothetical protein
MSISSVRKSRAAGTPSGNGYYAEYENKVSRRIVNPLLSTFMHGRSSVLEAEA